MNIDVSLILIKFVLVAENVQKIKSETLKTKNRNTTAFHHARKTGTLIDYSRNFQKQSNMQGVNANAKKQRLSGQVENVRKLRTHRKYLKTTH